VLDFKAALTRLINSPDLWQYIQVKTYTQYRARLWGAMVRLYNGGKGANFDGSFARSIDQQLTQAWNDGADDMGVKPDEMSKEDMNILEGIINNENDFILRIGDEIRADADAGMAREDFERKYQARLDLWANRFNETVNRAHIVFGGKQKLQWILGATEEHCKTCAALDGIVAWATEWDQSHFHPQMPPNDLLECDGWRCDCKLEPTTARRTSRALDKLMQIATEMHV
jgi:hypothetical protein